MTEAWQPALSSSATCADPESIVRGDPTLTRVFLVGEGREDPNTTISGPMKRHFNSLNSGLVVL